MAWNVKTHFTRVYFPYKSVTLSHILYTFIYICILLSLEHIQKQKEKLSNLKDGDFKQGLYDELNIVEDLLDKINKRV